MKLFDQSAPAESLEALVEFLQRDSPEHHIFRGQTRDFRRLLPSDFRRYDLGPGYRPHIHKIDQGAYLTEGEDIHTARRLGRELFRRINLMMLNLPLGNILSQQYGLTSQTLDFTRSVDVAAFFAIRDWPYYTARDSTDECGIIYRLKQPKVEISNELIDRMLQRVGSKMSGEDVWVWFDEFIPSWNHAGAQKIFVERGLQAAPTTVRLSSPSVCLTDKFLLANMKEQLVKERLHAQEYLVGVLRAITEDQFHEFGSRILDLAEKDFHSRLHAQRACLLTAPSWHDAFVPFPYFAMMTENPRVRLAVPPLAVGREWLGIEDLVQFSDFEAFYFRHAPSDSRILSESREALWPNEADPIFELYRWLFELAVASGEIDPRVTFDEKDTGILDRGFYLAPDRSKQDGVASNF
jgi:hypothetical protein